MIRTWTDEQKDFLRENYGKLSYAEISEHLGKPISHVKSQASNMKITVSRAWPPEHDQKLREMYADSPTQVIADLLGYKLAAVYGRAKTLGLHKSEAFKNGPLSGRLTKYNAEERGGKSRFQKGQRSWNKGTKGISGTHENCRKTQFKKGHRGGVAAKVYQPIGAERISKDGYLERKVNDGMPFQGRWEAVHRIIWKEAHGPIPKGHNIAFIDGNKQNFALDNLECVSRAEWMKRHTMHNYPAPVKEQIHILAGFKRRLNRYAEKQDRRSQEPAL